MTYMLPLTEYEKVSIQDPEDFPRTGRIGFMVSPGHQIEVTVTGQTQISNDRLETIGLDKRLCAADGEIKLKYFDRYTGPFCNLDCIIELFLNQCLCVPFYFPGKFLYQNLQKKTCSRRSH